jgi:hypothetical protein
MESCSASTLVDTEFRLVQMDSESADLLQDNKLLMVHLRIFSSNINCFYNNKNLIECGSFTFYRHVNSTETLC